MYIRTAAMGDLKEITEVERICFPAAEAAAEASFRDRLAYYPEHFWLLMDESGKMIGFVNGMVTNEEHLSDEMYENAGLHDEQGKWQMIFGVDTVPEYRRQGCAGILLEHVIACAKEQKRAGIVLTCKDRLVAYYAKFGFVDEGISESGHGGAVWHEMRLPL